MSIKIDKKIIANTSFKSEIKKTEEKSVEEKEEKSFYERNKTAIIALGVVGLATAAILMHKNLKTNRKPNINLFGDNERRILEEFKNKLNKLDKNSSSKEIIEEFFKTDNVALKLKGAEHLNTNKLINSENWEVVFDNIIKIEQTEKFSGGINGVLKNILINLKAQKELSPEVIDKILLKISKAPDRTKMNIFDSLSNHNFNEKQLKQILEELKKYNKKDYTLDYGSILSAKRETSNLRENFVSKYFEIKKVDADYIDEFKKIINEKFLSDEDILSLINNISNKKILTNIDFDTNISKLLKELINITKQSKVETFGMFKTSKFELLSRLSINVPIYQEKNGFSAEEIYDFYKNLLELAEKETPKYGLLGNIDRINNARSSFLSARTTLFLKNFKLNNSDNLQEIEKFVDEIHAGYDDAIAKKLKGFVNCDFLDINYGTLKTKIQMLIIDIELNSISNNKKIDMKKIDEILKKLDDFGKTRFNMKSSYRRQTSNSGKSNSGSFNFNSIFRDKKKEAISELVDFMKKETGFEKEIEMLEKTDLTAKELTKIKRKFALKYHPDKFPGDSEEMIKKRTEAEALFKKYNALIELIETFIKK